MGGASGEMPPSRRLCAQALGPPTTTAPLGQCHGQSIATCHGMPDLPERGRHPRAVNERLASPEMSTGGRVAKDTCSCRLAAGELERAVFAAREILGVMAGSKYVFDVFDS